MTMRKNFVIVMGLALIWTNLPVNAQSDTTHVTNFTLEEQEITLRVGESRQLHVNPADAKVRWMESWGLHDNPVSIVDANGLVTALKAGTSLAHVESMDASINYYCRITVVDEGSVRSDSKRFNPAQETEWKDVQFSLTFDGKLTAEGTFGGSGAQPNYLNYIVTDQCVFLWFDINYEDSTKMFYSQPFTLELNGCNAQEYNIYLNNRVQTVGSQSGFVMYSISRGSSIGGTTGVRSAILGKDDDLIYNLNGQPLQSVPQEGFYIKGGRVYLAK